jgi:hypothetical protein
MRNTAVQRPNLLAMNIPNNATKPETIPIRLSATWINVYACVDMPKIMICPFTIRESLYDWILLRLDCQRTVPLELCAPEL